MLLKNFYKKYLKLTNFFFILPFFKILKFKRTKWKNLQKIKKKNFFWKFNKKKKLKKKKFLFNNNELYTSVKNNKKKFFYKNSIKLKNNLFLYFNNAINIKEFKKALNKQIFDRKKLFQNLLLKPFFKIEILLWKLNIFKTVAETKQALIYKIIKLNNKFAQQNHFLKKGDIITIDKNILLKNNNLPFFLQNFIEIDYYTNSIILLSDYTHCNEEITSLFFPEIINLGFFIDFIKKS